MKGINKEAWWYLKSIDTGKWTIFKDEGNRRWGNLTTNISESWNGCLREARFLPITALINYIFEKDVAQGALEECRMVDQRRLIKAYNITWSEASKKDTK